MSKTNTLRTNRFVIMALQPKFMQVEKTSELRAFAIRAPFHGCISLVIN